MTRYIVFANRKGGCGKTTTAVNIACIFSIKNKKVLLVDLDPQAHATLSLRINPDPEKPNIYNLLDKKASFKEVIQQVITTPKINCHSITNKNDEKREKSRSKNLYIIPSSRNLSVVEMNAPRFSGDELYLAEILHNNASEFDYVIIDPPPSVGILSVSALVAAKEAYIPMPMHFLAMEGLAEMTRLIYQINATWNPELKLCGIIPTFYNKNTRITKEIASDIVNTFGTGRLAPPIRQNVALAEAPGHGCSIFEYAPDSIGAEDYETLAMFIENNVK
ncbi:MAG: ParA family protein [Desulfamplus sp.]|nr:ParA family protein [Desulfamplus sp.]